MDSNHNDIKILKAHEIKLLLSNQEQAIIKLVREAYETHNNGKSSLPHSTFLTFPDQPRDRIIALPTFLGEPFAIAGVKWIASFPGNHDLGLERASAVIIINSTQTGRPYAILEGSLISAKRTAASAALAAQYLHTNPNETRSGFVGAGLINFEIACFLLTTFPTLETFFVYDMLPQQAEQFGEKCRTLKPTLKVEVMTTSEEVFSKAALVSLATTAGEPHLHSLAMSPQGSTILHISLRDFSPDVVLGCDNVVDDIDHAIRARTSLHLTEQREGNRNFVRCTLADITSGRAPARIDQVKPMLFSPFGLGVLDLAVSHLVMELSEAQNVGTTISSFLPEK